MNYKSAIKIIKYKNEINKKINEKLEKIKTSFLLIQNKKAKIQKLSFVEYTQKRNVFLEFILPCTRQEWFEEMGICKFTDNFVDDKFTKKRKMGKLIKESINENKINDWVKVETNFMKKLLNERLGTDMGLISYHLHLDETTPTYIF